METIDLDDQSTESLFDEEGGEAFDVTNAEGEVDADLPSTDIKSSEDALDKRIGEQEDVSSSPENNSETEADEIDDIHDHRRPSDAAAKDDSIEDVAEIDDEFELRPIRKPRPRRYKIQEVIKMRQILLVQVVKEERGNKGAVYHLPVFGRSILRPDAQYGERRWHKPQNYKCSRQEKTQGNSRLHRCSQGCRADNPHCWCQAYKNRS